MPNLYKTRLFCEVVIVALCVDGPSTVDMLVSRVKRVEARGCHIDTLPYLLAALGQLLFRGEIEYEDGKFAVSPEPRTDK